MELTKIVRDLANTYAVPFGLGLAATYVYKTSVRVHSKLTEGLARYYNSRTDFSHDENFGDYMRESGRRDIINTFGFLTSGVVTITGLEHGMKQWSHNNDTTLLLTILAALTIGNIGSLAYEKYRANIISNVD